MPKFGRIIEEGLSFSHSPFLPPPSSRNAVVLLLTALGQTQQHGAHATSNAEVGAFDAEGSDLVANVVALTRARERCGGVRNRVSESDRSSLLSLLSNGDR